MRFILCLMLLFFSVPASVASAEEPSLAELRSQAELYLKRGRLKQARRALAKAYAASGGADDFGVVFMRAQVGEKLNLVAEAFRFAAEALKVATVDGQRAEAERLRTRLASSFGYVEFYAAPGESRRTGRVELSTGTVHINPSKKKQFSKLVKSLKNNGVEVPSRIYLPYGDYVANNVAFSIVNGEQAPVVELFLMDVSKKESEDDSLWWYLGIGGAATVVAGITAFILSREEDASRKVEVRVRISSLTGQE